MTSRRASVWLAAAALFALPFLDLSISVTAPWQELARLGAGILTPAPGNWGTLFEAVVITFALGLLATLLAAPLGLLLALGWQWRWVRVVAAAVRALHELFWAVLLMQVLGVGVGAALFALIIPYSGFFAKVFAEALAEAPDEAVQSLPPGTGPVRAWLLVRLPTLWPTLRDYVHLRAECGLRSSAVMGFLGVPTLGLHLHTALAYGAYEEAGAYLIALVALVLGFRRVTPARTWAIWILVLPLLLPWSVSGGGKPVGARLSALAHDLLPTMPPDGGLAAPLRGWLQEVLWLGVVNTLSLTVVTMATVAVLSLVMWPGASDRVSGRRVAPLWRAMLTIQRALPEYLLVYLFLLVFGPSMLPAIFGLTLHNAAIIAMLMGLESRGLPRRIDAPTGLRDFFWEVLPRSYDRFLALLLYRSEHILRESAVVGLLGLQTLGFFVDAALKESRLSALPPLLLVVIALNLGVDVASRRLRAARPEMARVLSEASVGYGRQ